MSQGTIAGTLRRNAANPRYFTDDTGRAIYLTGSHTWNNLIDMGKADPPPEFDFAYYLDVLEDLGHNFIRLWAWDMLCTWDERDVVRPLPWARTGPGLALDGKPKFDLSRFESEYFQRLRTRVGQAQERGIYVSVMLFDGWAIFERSRARRELHAFAGGNNVNGIDILASQAGGILRDWVTLYNPRVVALQEAYTRKVVETVNAFDNVLFEMCNEAGGESHDWQEHLIRFIRRCEAQMPKQHPVGTTGGMGTRNQRTYESVADWVSPEVNAADGNDPAYRDGGHTWGSAPFDRGDKVVLLDTDHLWGIGGDEVWAWKSFCRGYNVLYMDRCDDFPTAFYEHELWPDKHNPNLRREMGAILSYAGRMDLNRAVPSNDLCSTGYCLADPGREYIAYQPHGGPFALRLAPGTYRYEWHDPGSGKGAGAGDLRASAGGTELTPPVDGGAVLYAVRSK
jgi:hypothetical protein